MGCGIAGEPNGGQARLSSRPCTLARGSRAKLPMWVVTLHFAQLFTMHREQSALASLEGSPWRGQSDVFCQCIPSRNGPRLFLTFASCL